MQGIYKLSNNIDDRIYIGQSTNIENRFLGHIKTLKSNKHNSKLQPLFNSNINEICFNYEVLEFVENKNDLTKKEKGWIKHFNSVEYGFNIDGHTDKPTIEIINHNYELNKHVLQSLRCPILYTSTSDIFRISKNEDVHLLDDMINKLSKEDVNFTLVGNVNRKIILLQDKIAQFILWSRKQVSDSFVPAICYVLFSSDSQVTLYTSLSLRRNYYMKEDKQSPIKYIESHPIIYKNFYGENKLNDVYFIKNYNDYITSLQNILDYKIFTDENMYTSTTTYVISNTVKNILYRLYLINLISNSEELDE